MLSCLNRDPGNPRCCLQELGNAPQRISASLNLEVQPMYARYVIHLTRKPSYVYPYCNSLNDTGGKGCRSIHSMNGYTLIL